MCNAQQQQPPPKTFIDARGPVPDGPYGTCNRYMDPEHLATINLLQAEPVPNELGEA